ncbi:MAG TPA: hypothetical protein VHF47_09510 [Acidimicrobiales bacterium]|nr:hypothetical protein [Acidimicrobiales bacterium]
MTTTLRDALASAAGPVPAMPPEGEIERRCRRLRRRAWLGRSGGAVAVATLAVCAAVLPSGDGAPSVRTVGPAGRERPPLQDAPGAVPERSAASSTTTTTSAALRPQQALSGVPTTVPLVDPGTPPPGFVAAPPPGARVAFVYGSRIETMRPDGTDRRLLFDDGNLYEAVGWSPKRDRLALLHRHTLAVLDVNRGAIVTVLDRVGEGALIESADWSPDGKWIVYSARNPNPSPKPQDWHNLRLVRPDGSGDHEIPVHACEPVWAPDAKRIAAVSCAGSDGEMVVAEADGSRRTTLPGKRMAVVSWSPDGSWIAGFPHRQSTFGFGAAPPKLTLFRPDGSDVRTLPSGRSWQRPAWTTDSSRLIYASFPPNALQEACGPPPAHPCDERSAGLYSIAVDGSGEVELTSTGESWPVMPWR